MRNNNGFFHDFEDKLKIERHGNAILDAAYCRLGYTVVPLSKTIDMGEGVDRHLISHRSVFDSFTADFKIDEKATGTGNLALEHVSQRREGRMDVAGCLFTSAANCVCFFVQNNVRRAEGGVIYEIRLDYLRQRWPEISIHREWLRSAPNRTYDTMFYATPIEWLEARGFFRRKLPIDGEQLVLIRAANLPNGKRRLIDRQVEGEQ